MKNYLLVSLLLLIMFFPFSLQQRQDLPLHMKIKTLLTNVQSYLFPPNLEGSVGNDEQEPTVKEAVAKSLTEGKATVEETAKTAAEKLKETFYSHHNTQEDL